MASTRPSDSRLHRALSDVVGPGNVLDSPTDLAGYTRDWTGAFAGATVAVVRPGTPQEVAGVVQECRRLGHPLLTQGGNTGLVGGSVPLHGEVVLSTRRLVGVPQVDLASATATAWAGTPLQVVQEAAAAHGLAYAVDTASRGSATLGGTIATNAGGLRVLRHGDTRAQLLGVEAVLGSGAVVSHLGGLGRDNTGYHLPSLLAGSEGTLGVVTRATVRLVPRPVDQAVALVGFSSVSDAVAGASRLRRASSDVSAVELVLAGGMDLVAGIRGRRPPLATPPTVAALVVEIGCADAMRTLTELIADVPGVLDAALADTPNARAGLWAWRESHTECINTLGPPVKMDVTVPAGCLVDFIAEVPRRVAAVAGAGSRTWLFGHVAEGNVHVNVTGAIERADAVQDAVFGFVASVNGSISTEHGIGVAKRRWLGLSRSPEEIAVFRAIKTALDPDCILNPHCLLPEA